MDTHCFFKLVINSNEVQKQIFIEPMKLISSNVHLTSLTSLTSWAWHSLDSACFIWREHFVFYWDGYELFSFHFKLQFWQIKSLVSQFTFIQSYLAFCLDQMHQIKWRKNNRKLVNANTLKNEYTLYTHCILYIVLLIVVYVHCIYFGNFPNLIGRFFSFI